MLFSRDESANLTAGSNYIGYFAMTFSFNSEYSENFIVVKSDLDLSVITVGRSSLLNSIEIFSMGALPFGVKSMIWFCSEIVKLFSIAAQS